jgi:glycosyltransferase involved in cell wall biosynthesis
MDNRKVSIAITTYNRPGITHKAIEEVLYDSRVSEIIVLDDCSDIDNFNILCDNLKNRDRDKKIKISRNVENLGMMWNKVLAVSLCSNEFAILFDSDNILPISYIDILYKLDHWFTDVIYCPDYAIPNFDYTMFGGRMFDKEKSKKYIDDPQFSMMMNTCNYFVPKTNFVKSFVDNDSIKASDTIWIAYNWLKQGNKFHVVKDMQYYHAISEDSGFLKDCDYNMKKAEEIKQMIKEL